MDYKDPEILALIEEGPYLDWIQKQILQHPVVKAHHGKWKELIEWESEGNQFSVWDDQAATMMPVQLKRRKKRVVINIMKPLAETIDGKINFQAKFEGVPNSAELADINGAQVATKFLAHNDYVNDIEALNEDIKYDLIRTGNAFRKWVWESGKAAKVKDAAGKVLDSDGELVGSVPSVFNIRLDPTAKGMEDARWIIEIGEVTEDAVVETFGIDRESIRSATEARRSGARGSIGEQQKYQGMNEKPLEKDRDEPTYIMAWFWEKANSRYPEGRHIISIPGMVLWAKKNPALGMLPYFKYGYKRNGSSPYFTGPMHHVQDIQRDFNRMISIISEHVEGWRAKIVIDKNAGLKEGAFTTDSFEILEVDRSKGDPIPVNMPQLSPEVLHHRDFLLAAKDLVSNVHEVSYSQLPQYATRAPASLYAMMVEQENLKLDPMIRQINRNLRRESTFRLQMMGKYYDKKRQIKIIGVNERSSLEYYSGTDLHGNYDVKLVVGVSIHQSKTVQQRMLLDLKTAGAPIEWSTIFKLLWEGDVSEKIRGDIADERRASRENQLFLEGGFDRDFAKGGVQILLFDDHKIHLDAHTKLIKTEEAQRWDERTWSAMNQHIFQHMALMAQVMNRVAAAGGPDPGAMAAGQPQQAGPQQASPSVGDSTQAVEDNLAF